MHALLFIRLYGKANIKYAVAARADEKPLGGAAVLFKDNDVIAPRFLYPENHVHHVQPVTICDQFLFFPGSLTFFSSSFFLLASFLSANILGSLRRSRLTGALSRGQLFCFYSNFFRI